MLQETRERVFFRENPEIVQSRVESFVEAEDGQMEEGTSRLKLYSLPSPGPHDRRFLTVALRTPENPDSPLTGNLTLRYRDEPEGAYANRASDLMDRLEDQGIELIPPGEAQRLKRSDSP